MPIRDLLFQGAVSAALMALLVYVAKDWFTARLRESIAAEYRTQHERLVTDLRWETGRREKAARMADVLSEWIAVSHDPAKRNSASAVIEMQRRYWELALWIDSPTLRALNRALSGQPGANHMEALALARALLVGSESDPVRAEEFIRWPLQQAE